LLSNVAKHLTKILGIGFVILPYSVKYVIQVFFGATAVRCQKEIDELSLSPCQANALIQIGVFDFQFKNEPI